jgi:hypothetical protein
MVSSRDNLSAKRRNGVRVQPILEGMNVFSAKIGSSFNRPAGTGLFSSSSIVLSLRDKRHLTAEALLKLAFMGENPRLNSHAQEFLEALYFAWPDDSYGSGYPIPPPLRTPERRK